MIRALSWLRGLALALLILARRTRPSVGVLYRLSRGRDPRLLSHVLARARRAV